MNRKIKHGLLLAIGLLATTGCAGYDRILFITKTNVGLDIDNKPPTAEITIARRELAVTPTFQDATDDEKTLPLLASFGLTGTFLNPEITSRFAGGEAALILAQGPDRMADPAQLSEQSFLCLSKEPETKSWWEKVFGKDDIRPFYFSTDTAFGLKAAWDGTTGPYPSTVKLGYNRREFAFPPIFTTEKSCDIPGNQPNKNGWRVTVPSFVASLDNSSTITDIKEWVTSEKPPVGTEWTRTGVTHTQFFATGKAASEFVNRPEINSVMNKKMYPQEIPSIAPVASVLVASGTKAFKATGATGQVKFTLMYDTTGAPPINPSTGLYTAGSTPGTSIIGMADEAGKTATAKVTVNPALSITPNSQSVLHEQSFQFKATGGVPPLKFTLSDKQSDDATIDEKTGRYKAGSTAGKTDKIRVTDSSSPPTFVEATVTVQ
ncbi:MAG: hypothetical protein IPP12_21685 [Nitrospira sp.]|nr:hypothetical protein [Nitrospira sp.]